MTNTLPATSPDAFGPLYYVTTSFIANGSGAVGMVKSALVPRPTPSNVSDTGTSDIMTNTLPATSPDAFGPLYYVTGQNSKKDSHIFKG
jgi:hypothetical protein